MTYDPRSGPEKLASRVLVVVGLVGLVAAGFLFFASFGSHAIDESRIKPPGSAKVHLEAGEYELWIQGAGGTFNQGDCDRDSVVDLTNRAKPRILAADGSTVELVAQAHCASAAPFRGGRAVSALHFTLAEAGTYELRGGKAPTPETQLYVVTVHSILWTTIGAFVALFGSIGALVLKLVRFSG